MPELPEVETICRTLRRKILRRTIVKVVINNARLRQPVALDLVKILPGQCVKAITRRGKYILLRGDQGTLLIHLGMTGSLQLKPMVHEKSKHEHVAFELDHDEVLCYLDPRRFGLILWTTQPPFQHPLLKRLGCEPLTKEFTPELLWQCIQSHGKLSVKQLLMDSSLVVGIGNIYANEILYLARINPQRLAKELDKVDCRKITSVTTEILRRAIYYGGTTLQDYRDGQGRRGNFQKHLQVYGRAGQPCLNCQTPLATCKLGQRSTFYCPECQPR